MDGSTVAWVIGGYFAGTFPSTWIVARINHSAEIEASVRQGSAEGDAHIMTTKYLGWGWSAAASTVDVLKGSVWVLAARDLGHQGTGALAVAGVAVVAGHSFPFFAREYAGRGLAASAGVLLVLLPVEMLVAGLVILLGIAVRAGGLFSTVGMASVTPVAAAQRQPAALVGMGGAILALILVRRLQGVQEVTRGGVTPGKAILYRCLFDSNGPPPRQKGPRRYRAPRLDAAARGGGPPDAGTDAR